MLDDERAALVPIPYKLFSHTNTQGKFHTNRCSAKRQPPFDAAKFSPFSPARLARSRSLTLGHVVRLKDLTLVRCAVTVHGESSVVLLLPKVLLSESDSSAERNLSTDDTVTAKESEWAEEEGFELADAGRNGRRRDSFVSAKRVCLRWCKDVPDGENARERESAF